MAYTSGSDTKKTEVAYEEKIAVLEFKVKDKGYGDQLSKSNSEVLPSVFDSRSSDGDDNPTNDRFKKGDGYHVVPPPLTRNYMPPLADLSFAGLDDSVYRPTANKASASISKGEPSVIKTSNISVEMPKVDSVRTNGVIIKDCVSDDEDTLVDTQVDSQTTADRKGWNGNLTQKPRLGLGFTKKTCFVCGSKKHLIKDCDFYEKRMSKKSVLHDMGKGIGQREEVKFNLFSVSQMCDKKNSVLFTESKCLVLSPDFKLIDESQVLLRVPRQNNMYSFDLKNVVPSGDLTCLFAKATIDESKLWHRKLGHVNFKTMNKLVKGNLVRGLPSKTFKNDHTCVACQKGKSINHKTYCLVVTDDFSRFSWVFFLATKSETSRILKKFITEIENQLNKKVKVIRSDNGTEFKNKEMDELCRKKGIKKEYSVARTPQENGDAERKNMTLIEAARTMLADSFLPTIFWVEPVNTACYVLNRVLVTKPHNKTPYELIIGRPPSISFMRPFGCLVTILNTLDPLGKFDGKAEEGFLVGYFVNSNAFRVFNTKTRKVKENLHVNFLENKPYVAGQGPNWLFDIDSLANFMNYQPVTTENQANKNAGHQEVNGDTGLKKNVDVEHIEQELVSTQQYIVFPLWSSISSSYKSSDDKAGDNTADDDAVNTASASRTFIPPHDPLMPELEDTAEIQTSGIFSNAYDEDDLEPNNHSYVDESVGAEANFNNMEPSIIVSHIPTTRVHFNHPKAQMIGDPINKKDKRGIVVRNKTKLVAQGHKQEEGIDYNEVFAPVARVKVIRLFLAFASNMNFHVYQMDVKSVFLYGTIKEEMMDYGYNFMQIKIHVDNESVICVIKNPVYHSKTKHIEIRHYFIRDSYEKRLIETDKIHTDNNVADLLAKAFDISRFNFLVASIEVETLRYLSLVVPLKKVGDEAVHKELGDRMERAATTASSLEADQDSEFCDKHNMVAYLEKSEGSEGFHQIIEFLSASHINIIEDRVMAITATIDRNVKQLALMGYVSNSDTLTFQKVSSNIATVIICLATNRTFNFSKFIFDAMVKNLVKTSKARRKARIVISEDEDVEDPSKQRRSLIEELDMDVEISLVLADAAEQGRSVGNSQTYTRQRRRVNTASTLVSTADVSTASEMVNTTGLKARDKGKAVMPESETTKKIKKRIQVKIVEELAWKLHEEEPTRFNVKQEAIDIAGKEKVIAEGDQAHDIDWSDPAVIRYHTLQSRPRSVSEVRKSIAGGNNSQESVKKQELEDDTEKKELKAYLDIVPEDEFVMEVEYLVTKYPIIDWKTHVLTEHFMYYQIIRADGSSMNYKIFSEMLDDFDRQYVMDLHRLVEERYTTTSPEGYDLMLWGDLKILFEPDEENELWKNQH
nr:putative ribonuclease H-like domain-containing protein [Tanacetum cinerariifolium]